MDFERLFTLIIIMIIWGVSSILRKKAKADPENKAPADQKSGFFNILQQHLAALEEKSKEEEIIHLDEYLQPSHQSRTDEHEKKSLIEEAEDALIQEPPITGRETVAAAAPKRVAKPRPTILQKKPAMTNRRKLQNAVIWAEILAPPMALRDQ